MSEVWMWPLCPGQSLDHLAMNVAIMPLRCAEHLGEGLEQRAAIGGFERLAILNGRFEHARAGLGVQAFERNAQSGAHVHELVIELRVHARAQHRVAEEARRHGGEVAEALVAHATPAFP